MPILVCCAYELHKPSCELSQNSHPNQEQTGHLRAMARLPRSGGADVERWRCSDENPGMKKKAPERKLTRTDKHASQRSTLLLARSLSKSLSVSFSLSLPLSLSLSFISVRKGARTSARTRVALRSGCLRL